MTGLCEHIDITVTATLRPELLERTLVSFEENLFHHFSDCRAVVNIDPTGSGGVSPEDAADVVRKYFKRYVIFLPPKPHFGRAFHRVWLEANALWVFHLEEDWELLRPIDFLGMLQAMQAEPDLAVMRLSAFPAGPDPMDMMKNWNRRLPFNGTYYECPKTLCHRIGFCGHPSLIRGDWLRAVRVLLDPERNPEKQFQGTNPDIEREVLKWRYGVWARPGDPPAIRDIGRAWMKEHGLVKSGPQAFFITWEQAPGKEAAHA